MPYDLIIRNVQIVSPEGVSLGDVAIEGSQFAEVGTVSGNAQAELDGMGLHLMAGLIDTQVHFREPGAEHKEDIASGSLAALVGGVTTFFEMPNTNPPTTTAERLSDKLARSEGRASSDYAYFVGASQENVDHLAELEQLPGTPGIKIFVGSSTGSLLVENDELLEQVLKAGARPCSIHSEDEPRLRERLRLASKMPTAAEHNYLRDAEAAVIATKRVLHLAEKIGRPVHILHISTGDEVPIIRAAKANGIPVTAEVTPQHLYFSAPECYETLGSHAQMNPPLREAYHTRALWEGLDDGLFDVFGSDHAPHTLAEKELPYLGVPGSPSGMPGVQTLLPVLLSFLQQGRLTLPQIARMACERPAELFGISGKGKIAPGFDADFLLFDAAGTQELRREQVVSRAGWSPYEGQQLGLFPEKVYLRGSLAAQNGHSTGSPNGRSVRFTWKS